MTTTAAILSGGPVGLSAGAPGSAGMPKPVRRRDPARWRLCRYRLRLARFTNASASAPRPPRRPRRQEGVACPGGHLQLALDRLFSHAPRLRQRPALTIPTGRCFIAPGATAELLLLRALGGQKEQPDHGSPRPASRPVIRGCSPLARVSCETEREPMDERQHPVREARPKVSVVSVEQAESFAILRRPRVESDQMPAGRRAVFDGGMIGRCGFNPTSRRRPPVGRRAGQLAARGVWQGEEVLDDRSTRPAR